MNSSALQNPSDPDAAYRNKAGKLHRGYAANLVAKEKNVVLVTTALIGKEAPDVLADFEFSEDGTRLI